MKLELERFLEPCHRGTKERNFGTIAILQQVSLITVIVHSKIGDINSFKSEPCTPSTLMYEQNHSQPLSFFYETSQPL